MEIKCPDCDNYYSDKNLTCPFCNIKQKQVIPKKETVKSKKAPKKIIFILLSLFIIFIIGLCSRPDKNSTQPSTPQTIQDSTPLTAEGKIIKNQHQNWSNHTCNAIANKKIFIGMTEEQAIASWGLPHKINTTTGTYGVHEQWVMSDDISSDYVYFQNGILSTIQQSH